MSPKVINQSLDKKQIPVMPLLLVTALLLGSILFFVLRISSEETRLNETWSQYASVNYTAGTGSYDDPYRITKAEDLALLSKQVNEGLDTTGLYYELACDVDLSDREWMPIGTSNPFKGTFDGNGYKIVKMNVAIKKKVSNYGLFGIMEGKVVDLRIGNSAINLSYGTALRNWLVKDDICVGLLAGINRGSITNVAIRGEVSFSKSKGINYGFLCGKNDGGLIDEALTEGEAVFNQCKLISAGGIAGSCLDNSTIRRSSFVGKIKYYDMKNDDYHIGGTVGLVKGDETTFFECVSKSSVATDLTEEMTENVGSFVGNSSDSATYEKCISICRFVSQCQDEYVGFSARGQCKADASGAFNTKNTIVLVGDTSPVSVKNDSDRNDFYKREMKFSTQNKKWTISVEDVIPRLQVCMDSYDCRLEKTEKALVNGTDGKKKIFRYGVYDSEFIGREYVDGVEYIFKRGIVTNPKVE